MIGTKRLGLLKGIPIRRGWRKGTWMVTAAVVGGGLGIAGGAINKPDAPEQPEIQVKKLDEYPESGAARETMAGKLQEWGDQPGYGAISPDWGDIWERAKNKIGRYYWGGVGETGLAGKVKASAARRGVSESPAMETQLTRMGQQEGLELKDVASEQALQESLFGEQGRQNWFGQMQNLAGMKPSYATSAGVTQPQVPGAGAAMGELGSSIAGIGQQYAQNKWMDDYLKRMVGQQNLGTARPSGGGYSPSPYSGPGYSGTGPVVA